MCNNKDNSIECIIAIKPIIINLLIILSIPTQIKQEADSSLNSTFVVDETEDKVPPLPKTKGMKRISSNTENETPGNKSSENSEDGISDLDTKNRQSRKHRRRTGLANMKTSEDNGSDDSHSSSLKRRSADDPEDLDSSEDGHKKRKRRLLNSNASGFFSHLNGQS